MKIQNIHNYMNYKGSSKPIKNEEIKKTNNYDVIEIKGKTPHEKETINLESIKKNIVLQVNKESNAEKVNRIKENINNKTYNIDAVEIVNKLLR